MIQQHVVQPELFIADLARVVVSWILLQQGGIIAFLDFLGNARRRMLFSKLLRANVARKQRDVEILVLFLDVASEAARCRGFSSRSAEVES